MVHVNNMMHHENQNLHFLVVFCVIENPSPAWQVQFTQSDEVGSHYHNALYRLRAFDMTKYQDIK